MNSDTGMNTTYLMWEDLQTIIVDNGEWLPEPLENALIALVSGRAKVVLKDAPVFNFYVDESSHEVGVFTGSTAPDPWANGRVIKKVRF